MTKEQAEWMVKALGGGEAARLRTSSTTPRQMLSIWLSGGGIYLVRLPKDDGRRVCVRRE